MVSSVCISVVKSFCLSKIKAIQGTDSRISNSHRASVCMMQLIEQLSLTIQILHTTKSADCIHFYILFPKSTTVAQKSVDLALSIKSIDASMFLSYIDTKNLHGSHQRSDAISSDVVVKIKTKSS